MKFCLPDIGEGIKDVTITDLLVKKQQNVKKNDTVLIIESDKASMEIPIKEDCIIESIHIKIGDIVSPGDLLFNIKSTNKIEASEFESSEQFDKNNIETSEFESNEEVHKNNIDSPIEYNESTKVENKKTIIYTSPSVRKLARELNCNLNSIKGTGKNGRITLEDVKNNKGITESKETDVKNLDDNNDIFNQSSKWGLTEKLSLNTIKKTTSKRLHDSWISIPHVTQFDECDITKLDKIRKTIKSKNTDSKIKVSFIPFFIKAIQKVLEHHPIFNTSLSENGDYLIQKNYFNIGIAVNTDRGLVVPVIKDVNNKSIKSIAKELTILISKAKNKRLTIEDMSGGSITISSLGNIGGKFFTPIINPPEVAILGISKINIKPILITNKFRARKILPISLSYDHRVIDGSDAVNFTNLFSQLISNPTLLNEK